MANPSPYWKNYTRSNYDVSCDSDSFVLLQMSQPSSQDSTDTQEIYSQGTFAEIWESLGRTFSNPENVIQG